MSFHINIVEKHIKMDAQRTFKTSEAQRQAFRRWYSKKAQDPEWRELQNMRLRVWRLENPEKNRELCRAACKRFHERKKAEKLSSDQTGISNAKDVLSHLQCKSQCPA